MASNYVPARHNIGIVDPVTAETVGMMLAKRQDGTPAYEVFDRKNLADQFFTGTPQQTYQDPEEELPIIQSDWRSGFGLEIADILEPKRYFSSIGIMVSFATANMLLIVFSKLRRLLIGFDP